MTLLGEFSVLSTIPNSLYASLMGYERMTSNPNVEPRTYAASVPFYGFLKDKTDRDQWDDRHNSTMSIETASLVTDTTVLLTNGDIITDSTGKKWAYESRDSSGPATIHYTLAAANPNQSTGGNREGGV